MGNDRTNIEIAVECIECGQDVCVHQQKVIRDFERRLREAEAELARERTEFEAMTDLHDQKHRDWQEAEARAERLEAELREAREALEGVAHFSGPVTVAAMTELASRARGVLEKGDTGPVA